MPLHGFIFDLDGVLTDTAEYHYQAWQRLADELGIPFDRERNEALRGVSRRRSLELLLAGRVYPEEQMLEMMERKNRYYQELLKQVTPDDLLPGARALLEALRTAGMKIAIGSASKNAREVVQRLQIASCIDAMADGYSVVRPKPAPDLFVYAAGLLQCVCRRMRRLRGRQGRRGGGQGCRDVYCGPWSGRACGPGRPRAARSVRRDAARSSAAPGASTSSGG